MLDKFIKLNNKILKDFKSKESIVIVDRARPIPTIEASVMIAAIANKKKLKTIILTDKVYPNLIKIYKSFGYFNFHLVFNTKPRTHSQFNLICSKKKLRVGNL